LLVKIGAIEAALHLWSRARTRLFSLFIAGQFRAFGSGSRVTPPIRFNGLHRIQVGEGVNIERHCWIQTIGSSADDQEVKLVIGARASIGMGASISAARRVTIGEDVLFARNVYISDHAHAYEDIKVPIMRQGITEPKPVTIGRHAWLGQNVVVLPGVSIGEHCVIGANSVVNASIPDYCVAVGTPARVVRRYNAETRAWESVKTARN
jgi:acetyltransferase-like isoleucine patch superfamily enzyme